MFVAVVVAMTSVMPFVLAGGFLFDVRLGGDMQSDL